MTSQETRDILRVQRAKEGWKDARGGRSVRFGGTFGCERKKRETERCVERGAAERDATLREEKYCEAERHEVAKAPERGRERRSKEKTRGFLKSGVRARWRLGGKKKGSRPQV